MIRNGFAIRYSFSQIKYFFWSNRLLASQNNKMSGSQPPLKILRAFK